MSNAYALRITYNAVPNTITLAKAVSVVTSASVQQVAELEGRIDNQDTAISTLSDKVDGVVDTNTLQQDAIQDLVDKNIDQDTNITLQQDAIQDLVDKNIDQDTKIDENKATNDSQDIKIAQLEAAEAPVILPSSYEHPIYYIFADDLSGAGLTDSNLRDLINDAEPVPLISHIQATDLYLRFTLTEAHADKRLYLFFKDRDLTFIDSNIVKSAFDPPHGEAFGFNRLGRSVRHIYSPYYVLKSVAMDSGEAGTQYDLAIDYQPVTFSPRPQIIHSGNLSINSSQANLWRQLNPIFQSSEDELLDGWFYIGFGSFTAGGFITQGDYPILYGNDLLNEKGAVLGSDRSLFASLVYPDTVHTGLDIYIGLTNNYEIVAAGPSNADVYPLTICRK